MSYNRKELRPVLEFLAESISDRLHDPRKDASGQNICRKRLVFHFMVVREPFDSGPKGQKLVFVSSQVEKS